MLKLVIQDDQDRRTSVPLVRDEITIGRSEENTIRLTERNVSRSHARIVREDDKVYLEDMSRYGVRKNGARVQQRTAFQFGDVVVIGDYRLFLKKEASAAAGDDEFASEKTRPHIPSGDRAAVSDERPMQYGAFLGASHAQRGEAFPFPDQGILVAGRGETVDMRLDHSSVSKRHALLRRDAAGHILEDLNSANGVYVNEEKVSTAFLGHGDRVRLGELELVYCAPGNVLPPLPADVEPVVMTRGGGPPLALVVGGVMVLLVVAGGLFLLTRGDAEAPEEGAASAVVAAVDAPVQEPADRAAMALTEGQRALGEGQWSEAIAAFDTIDADSDHHELAQSLRRRAENESEREAIWESLNARMDLGLYDEALELLQEIPVGTYYRTRSVNEQVEQRLIEALVAQSLDASITAEEEGDLREARAVVDQARAWAPTNERLRQRLRELDARRVEREPAARRTQEAPRQAAPAPVAARQPEPRRTGREAAQEPPTPPQAEPAAPPEPAFNPVERANQLKSEARQVIITGDRRTAIRQLEEARRLNPGDAEINLMLYQNYRGVGNNRQAAAALERYMRQRPDDRRPEYVEFVEAHGR